MQKIGLKQVGVLNLALLLVLGGFVAYRFFIVADTIVYVDAVKLFDSFDMTKEMKRVGEKEFNYRKKIVDSLYAEAQRQDISETEKAKTVQYFAQKRDELEQFGQAFAGEESAKIWSRIKSYTQDFASENQYDLVVGSGDRNNILFADESVDVTSDLTNYINKKYEGLK